MGGWLRLHLHPRSLARSTRLASKRGTEPRSEMMRRFAVPLLLTLALMPGAVSAHGEAPQAMHGGLIKEAQELWVELVVKGADVAVYVVDEARKPVPANQVAD